MYLRSVLVCSFLALVAGCGDPGPGPDGAIPDGSEVGDGGSGDASTESPDGAGPACVGECTLGAKSCDGNAVRTCIASASTCTTWSAPEACAGSDVCSGGACVTACTDQCTLGATYCSGAGVRTCVTTVAGCTDWSPGVAACQNGTVCSGGVCAASCTDRCAAGATQCGFQPQTCERKPSGCLDWGDPIACTGGQVCSGGSCATSCTDQCTAGAVECTAADTRRVCEKQASGCYEWSVPKVCDSGNCQQGACAACLEGAKRCGASGNVEVCGGQGWVQTTSCAFGCTSGTCSVATTCTPGAYRCSGKNVEICNASGTSYLYNSSCLVACTSGLCTGQCTPGQRRCNGATVETCDASGTGFAPTTTCTTSCDGPSATCVLPSLEITVDTDLNGEVVVAGPVTVVAPAKITSSSGNLTLRAQSINVAQGAQITVSPTGTSPEGTPTTTCNYGQNDGSGGGYGSNGSTGACASSTYVGKAWGFATDAVVTQGSPGGKGYFGCTPATGFGSGGKGGGVLRLFAPSITIAGGLSANGEGGSSATAGNCGGGGGGSGGGILVAADQLTVAASATLSAIGGNAGGAGTGTYSGGKGGDGRIKLLYGSSRSVAGSATPAAVQGLMPPTTITSVTHPSQTLFYNDDFPAVGFSWNKAFPSVAGYWYRVNTSASSVPGADPQSTFLGTELVSVSPALLATGSTGDRWFHLTSIDPASVVGLLEQPYRIRVNATPPTIASPTHPSSSTWYTSGTAFFQWTHTAPIAAANDDANFRGYYYVLDHYGDTIPTTAATFLPVTQKQLNITNLLPAAGSANGAADGVWGFHVISVDQAGYLTKNASHYVVRIASSVPVMSNVAGQVFENDGGTVKPLVGATVKINRGLLTAPISSGTNGTYNYAGNVPVGTWEITATKAGYMPATQMAVVGATTATVNLTLEKIP